MVSRSILAYRLQKRLAKEYLRWASMKTEVPILRSKILVTKLCNSTVLVSGESKLTSILTSVSTITFLSTIKISTSFGVSFFMDSLVAETTLFWISVMCRSNCIWTYGVSTQSSTITCNMTLSIMETSAKRRVGQQKSLVFKLMLKLMWMNVFLELLERF